jgi:hemerythrin-like metal-binding protein
MSMFVWSDRYAVGNAEIDAQHRHLFDIFNRLYEECCQPDSHVDIYETLDELIDYAALHFASEQQYMHDIGYPGLEKQLQEHLYFTNEVLRLVQDRDLSTGDLTRETIAFLGKWLLHHVSEEDRKIMVSPHD